MQRPCRFGDMMPLGPMVFPEAVLTNRDCWAIAGVRVTPSATNIRCLDRSCWPPRLAASISQSGASGACERIELAAQFVDRRLRDSTDAGHGENLIA